MCNLYKAYLIAFSFFVTACGISKPIKPLFKKIVYVYYTPVKESNKISILIGTYMEIDENGRFRVATNYTDGRHYLGSGRDTSYLIPDSIVLKLNDYFSSRNRLDAYPKTQSPMDLKHYSDELSFLSYTDDLNISHQIILLDGAFREELQNVLEKILILPRSNILHKNRFFKNATLEKSILDCQLAANYIPENHFNSPPVQKKPVKN